MAAGRWISTPQFDPPDAIRLCTMIEAADLHPYFIEDLIRSEGIRHYETIRQRTKVPIARANSWGTNGTSIGLSKGS